MFPGVAVFETVDLGGGFGDCVAAYCGETVIVEIKPEGKEKHLTANEKVFAERWPGKYIVTSDPYKVLDLLNYPDFEII